MQTEASTSILLFDGVCNLCNRWVQYVLTHDRKAQFRFAALQSDIGRQYVQQFGLDPDRIDTVVLIQNDRIYLRSDAALQTLITLGGWRAVALLAWPVPRILRDGVYNWIARNRYRWFGREASCWLPRPEWKARFL